ncbi:MAG: carbon storage regulator [Pirellulales bacterium]
MLVLSRKIGETVVIGGNIEVTVTRVAGNRVTLGISAPSSVRVVRAELGRSELPAANVSTEPLGATPANTQEKVVATRLSQFADGAGETASSESNLPTSDAITAPIRMVAGGEGPASILSTVG